MTAQFHNKLINNNNSSLAFLFHSCFDHHEMFSTLRTTKHPASVHHSESGVLHCEWLSRRDKAPCRLKKVKFLQLERQASRIVVNNVKRLFRLSPSLDTRKRDKTSGLLIDSEWKLVAFGVNADLACNVTASLIQCYTAHITSTR